MGFSIWNCITFAMSALIVALLSGCMFTTTEINTACPPFPKAGPAVAEELETIPYENYEDTWEWFGRLDKHKDQIDNCRKGIE